MAACVSAQLRLAGGWLRLGHASGCAQHAAAAERWPCAARCRNLCLWLRHSGYALGRRLPRRARRRRVAAFPAEFPAIWDERRDEIVKWLRYLETYDLAGKSPAEIWQFMVDARAFHVRAWEIHFDLMYPLTANYLGFYGLCKELGIAAADIPKFLQATKPNR